MTLNQPAHAGRLLTYRDLARILLLIAAVIIFVAALNMAFGMPQASPIYDVVPDPAGPLPF
ncbi:MAG TPA: hypothetical protein VF071_09365 [Candidatus Limnocylindria bacterium]